MLRHRSSLFILSPVAWFAVHPASGYAQEPNLDSRLDSISPQQTETTLESEVEYVERVTTRTVRVGTEFKTVEIPEPELRVLLAQKTGVQTYSYFPNDLPGLQGKARGLGIDIFRKIEVPKYKTFTDKSKEKVVKPRKVTLTAGMPSSYVYNSNVTSSSDAKSDMVMSVAPESTLRLPVGASDTLSFFVGSSYGRYDTLEELDRDILVGTVTYARSLADNETIAARVSTRSSWLPGYSNPRTTSYSPAVEWGMDKLPVGSANCGDQKIPVPCFQAKIGASAQYNWYEGPPVLDNAFASATFGLDWNIKPDKFILKFSGALQGRSFDNTDDDRRDAAFVAGLTAVWKPSANATLTTGVTFARQISTRDEAEYEAFQAIPQLRLDVALGEWSR